MPTFGPVRFAPILLMEADLPTETCRETREVHCRPALDRHRALRSLIEELEAVDGYDHWIDASEDCELKAVLARCRDQVKGHAAMLLEWIRCRDPELDVALGAHLFKSGAEEAGLEARDALGRAFDALTEPPDAPLFDSSGEGLGFTAARRR